MLRGRCVREEQMVASVMVLPSGTRVAYGATHEVIEAPRGRPFPSQWFLYKSYTFLPPISLPPLFLLLSTSSPPSFLLRYPHVSVFLFLLLLLSCLLLSPFFPSFPTPVSSYRELIQLSTLHPWSIHRFFFFPLCLLPLMCPSLLLFPSSTPDHISLLN